MTLRIFNTLTGQKEDFNPIVPNQVGMYVCGITPYDETHLGHGRAYVTFDVVRRFINYVFKKQNPNFKLTYVQNITDIDDKIINRANEQGITIQQLSHKYIDSYDEVMDRLNVLKADSRPRATEYIDKMVEMINALVAKGAAYVVEGDVYFSVRKVKTYGELSHRDLEGMESGARVKVDERKNDPLDFALWKAAKPGEPFWDSPWGKGRPGWHTECVVMSADKLGRPFDIHGGGRDLICPHHENELAQAQALEAKPFVKYWMHNGFVNVNQEKMSKSLGNFFTLKDIFAKFDPMVVRFFLLQTHYRSPINFSDEALREAETAFKKIQKAITDIDFYSGKAVGNGELPEYDSKAFESMYDDFNTAGAIAAVFECIHFLNEHVSTLSKKSFQEAKIFILNTFALLGIDLLPSGGAGQSYADSTAIELLIAKRAEAKKAKNFALADEIRKQLAEQGITLEDTAHGTKWTKA